jgi:hypothetical protein
VLLLLDELLRHELLHDVLQLRDMFQQQLLHAYLHVLQTQLRLCLYGLRQLLHDVVLPTDGRADCSSGANPAAREVVTTATERIEARKRTRRGADRW